MEIKGYITNLGKYNEGELIGKWITFPIDDEELENVLKEIGINEEYEEYFFTDFENNMFDFGEYTNINEINDIVERYNDLCEWHNEEIVNAMCDYYGNFNEMENDIDNIYTYYGVDDMSDVARQYIDDTCLLGNIPSDIANYFDYESYGNDMEDWGTWIWFGENNQNVICVYY